MISYERQNEILELLKEHHTVTVEFLCRRLFASGATVRRDLAEMAQKGLLERVRGGATLISGTSQDAPLLVRTQKDREKKKAVAGLAAGFSRRQYDRYAGFQLHRHLPGRTLGKVQKFICGHQRDGNR